jgi:hypothetical protein
MAAEDCGQEDVCALVISSCDTTEVLEAAEHPLDDVTAFVCGLIVAMRMLEAGCVSFLTRRPVSRC